MEKYNDYQSYMLSHRRSDEDEDRRLDTQHDVIKHAILDGNLLHPSVELPKSPAIADLGCGTGVWLNDVAQTVLHRENASSGEGPTLIGFDINSHAFKSDTDDRIYLVEHDCTQKFDDQYLGRFDLVNARGLAYALPRNKFAAFLDNAVQLLKPGGYFQWLETESQLFKPFPETTDMRLALDFIKNERQKRDLILYMPHFMLQHFVAKQTFETVNSEENVNITSFSLCPGGFSRQRNPDNLKLNDRFSDVVLESIKLLLGALPLQTQADVDETQLDDDNNASKVSDLIEMIDRVRRSGQVKMGGHFPYILLRKGGISGL